MELRFRVPQIRVTTADIYDCCGNGWETERLFHRLQNMARTLQREGVFERQ